MDCSNIWCKKLFLCDFFLEFEYIAALQLDPEVIYNFKNLGGYLLSSSPGKASWSETTIICSRIYSHLLHTSQPFLVFFLILVCLIMSYGAIFWAALKIAQDKCIGIESD